MLKSVLAKEKCMNCKNCCVFYSDSRWEMPAVSEIDAEEICKFLKNKEAAIKTQDGYKMHSILRSRGVNGKDEEYRCAALDEERGCTLPEHLKPIECSMWPVRVMNDCGKIFICLASSCHGVDGEFQKKLTDFLNESFKDKIIAIVNNNKNIIKQYDNSYFKLMEITEEINE